MSISLLLSLLVACGSGTAETPPPASGSSPSVTSTPRPDTSTPMSTQTVSQPLGTSSTPDPALLRARLVEAGFDVGDGRAGVLPIETCCAWFTCFKWNPSSSYVMWWLPLSPGESSAGRELDADGLQWHWRLRADEVVVSLARTPPEVRYHAYRTDVHSSWSVLFQAHLPAFDNFGDTLNNAVLHTEGGVPHEANTVVISGLDAERVQRVRDELVASGYPESWHNVDVIPPDGLHLGLDDKADTFKMLHRVARFADSEAGEAWLANPTETVWRLTPRVEKAVLDPLPVPPFRVGARPPEDNELHLQGAVDELGQAIRDAHADLAHVELPVTARKHDPTEPCWPGCNRDSLDSNARPIPFPTGPDRFMIIFGVDHHATGFAAYQNAILFGQNNDDPGAWVSDDQWKGSAAHYLPGHPDVDKLYAWMFTRDCAGRPYCTEIVDGCPGIGLYEDTAVHFRAYLDPELGASPRPESLLRENVLLFQPPAPTDGTDSTGGTGLPN